jgi:hypothetical protein
VVEDHGEMVPWYMKHWFPISVALPCHRRHDQSV